MDAAQIVAQSLGRSINFCLLYLVVVVGTVILLIAVFKAAAWIADRRSVPPSSNGRTPGFEPGDAGPTPAGGSEK